MITANQFNLSALSLNCEVACIKAVAEVESSGSGFLPTGEPVILFEPHQFWRELLKVGHKPGNFIPAYSDILYPKWGTRPYGKSSEQHGRLARACEIHREAALQSASWGRFQIMGYHWKACGFDSLQEFINGMYESEDMHLQAFCNFLKSTNLDDSLRAKDWTRFARGYNGAGYAKNKYHIKLATAYNKYK